MISDTTLVQNYGVALVADDNHESYLQCNLLIRRFNFSN